MRILNKIFVTLLACFVLAGCSKKDPVFIFEQSDVLVISPMKENINKNTSLAYTATLIKVSGEQQDVTEQVSWKSNNTALLSINTHGIAKSIAGSGSEIVSAQLGNLRADATLTITDKPIKELVVTPKQSLMLVGITKQLTATLIFNDNTQQDISRDVTWTAKDNHETVNKLGLVTAISISAGSEIEADYLSQTDSATVVISTSKVKELNISPSAVTLPIGAKQQLIATLVLADNKTIDVTHDVRWFSSASDISGISADGLLTTYRPGNNNIFALLSYAQKSKSSRALVTVSPATLVSIEITPKNITLPEAAYGNYTAIGFYSDSTQHDLSKQVFWRSSDSSIVSIRLDGLATANKAGSVTISATLTGINATTTATVSAITLQSIDITPKDKTFPVGAYGNYTAIGHYSDSTQHDLSKQVFWGSSENDIVSIQPDGLAVANKVGTSKITATFSGVSAETDVTINAATLQSIKVVPARETLPEGIKLQYSAYGVYSDDSVQNLTEVVSWTVKELTGQSTFDPTQKGLLTTIEMGDVQPKATLGSISGITNLTIIKASDLDYVTLTPHASKVAVGTYGNFTIIATYNLGSGKTLNVDVTRQTDWSTDQPDNISIDKNGLALAIHTTDYADADIYAHFKGTTHTATVEVIDPKLDSIEVTPFNILVTKGNTQKYTATAFYSDGHHVDITTQASWVSSDPSIMSVVSSSGFAQTHSVGDATIKARFSSLASNASAVKVTDASLVQLKIQPETEVKLPNGLTYQYQLVASYSDGHSENLKDTALWESSDDSVVTMSSYGYTAGLASALSVGTAVISATASGHSPVTTNITITGAMIDHIDINPMTPTVVLGAEIKLSANAIADDSTSTDITDTATWTSSDPNILSVDNHGNVVVSDTYSGNEVTVTAEQDGKVGSVIITVLNKHIANIQITPDNINIKVGNSVNYTITAVYDNSTTDDVTALSILESLKPAVASIENGHFVKGVSVGSAELKATYLGAKSEREFVHVVN